MKKIFALLLAVMMVLSMAACNKAPAGTGSQAPAVDSFKDPYADITDYDELSRAVYDDVLGEFYKYYE